MVNPQKELFKWGPIDFKVFYGSFFIETLWLHVCKNYPWPWPTFWLLFQNGQAIFICENKKLKTAGAKYFKRYFLNPKNYEKQWLRWKKWVKNYNQRAKKYEQINLSKISDSELLNLFKDFYKFNIDFWLIVHVPEIANWGGEWLLQQQLQKIDKIKANKYLEILSAPVKYSFFQKEELDLLKSTRGSLEAHTKKYYWILNSYGGNRVLKANYFSKKLKDLLPGTTAKKKISEIQSTIIKNKKRKSALIKKLNLNKEIAIIADQLSQSIWWQDLRKGYIWRMHYFWDKFLKEVVKRTDWKFDDLPWCWPGEVIKILEDKRVGRQKIVSRKKNYAVYLGEKGNIKHLYGKTAQNLLKIYQPKVERGVKELRGLAVSRGASIRGKIKIIKSPFRESKKMKKGDILVASMTSPEFIVVMKKAKAIITDHGGMTSHAAIVSRELGIPCVVGTKIATKVLRDNDLVEVDANRGVIQVLKK